MKKENRGGPGRGQGRKHRFGEETKNVTFRCPESKVEEFRIYGNKKLAKWVKKKKEG
jgi:hypothetical protein